MNCPSCTRAETNPLTGQYTAHCRQCEARALAISHQFHDSKIAKKRTVEYQESLTKIFGAGEEDAGHALVKSWDAKMRANADVRPDGQKGHQ